MTKLTLTVNGRSVSGQAEGRTLLSYEASAESRRGRGNGAILAGLVCLGVAGLHGFIMRRAG